MSHSLYNSKSFLQIDTKKLCEFSNIITEKSIIETVKSIENLLVNLSKDKIDDLSLIMIEVLQNILNYSIDTKDLGNNKRESKGTFTISAHSKNNSFTIQTSNIININQKDTIIKKYTEIKDLDEIELRKLSREKRRSKKDLHEKGAGLGFIVIAMRVSEPISIEFIPYQEDNLEFILTLHL